MITITLPGLGPTEVALSENLYEDELQFTTFDKALNDELLWLSKACRWFAFEVSADRVTFAGLAVVMQWSMQYSAPGIPPEFTWVLRTQEVHEV